MNSTGNSPLAAWRNRDLDLVAASFGLPAEPVPTNRQAPVPAQVRAGIDTRLRAMISHDPGTRRGEDPEELHQMRVSVRRMRAMLKSARPFLDERWSEPLRAELGWLGRSLGPVRDLDVLLERLRAETADLDIDERASATRLISGLEREHGEARYELLAALDSDRYLALVRALCEAVRTPQAPEESSVDSREELRALVRKEFNKLRKDVDRIGESPPDDQLHALRIRGKRLRYTAELAEPAFGKDMQSLLKAAKRLQDVLGEHQDACVAQQRVRDLLTEFGDGVDAGVAFVAGRMVEREAARRVEHRARWYACWLDVQSAAEML
jgi:CHAD domain-containing protein